MNTATSNTVERGQQMRCGRATVDAIVETTMATGVLVLDLADMDELDIDLMRSKGQ